MNRRAAAHRLASLRLVVVVCLTLLCTAPTPGDVGGCGQPAQDLDADAFFQQKRRIDCRHCEDCGFSTETCEQACADEELTTDGFPAGCYPLVHDGEVCLRALDDASCSEYRTYVDDDSSRVPSECNFCPPREEP